MRKAFFMGECCLLALGFAVMFVSPAAADPNLVANWQMEEAYWNGTSGEVADSSGNGHNGTAVGNANTYSNGYTGRTGGFDGSGDYVRVPDQAALRFTQTNAFTIAFWFKGTSGGATRELISKRNVWNGYWISMDTLGRISATIRGSTVSNALVVSSSVYNDGEWHYLVCAYDGANTLKLSIDGEFVGKSSPTTLSGVNTTGVNLTIGYGPAGGFTGYIDEVAIWDGVIDIGEVENIALGKSYAFNYAPDYVASTNGDLTDLTDGAHNEGDLSAPSSVGWYVRIVPPSAVAGPRYAKVTIDLGSDMPIRGAKFFTAGGVSGIFLPENILMLAGTDNTNFHLLTDLVYSDPGLMSSTNAYFTYKYRTFDLQAHGRYVQFVIFGGGSSLLTYAFLFCDEIEVYKGENSWTNSPIPGPLVLSDSDLGVQRRLYYDLLHAREAVYTTTTNETLQAQLLANLANVEAGFTNYAVVTNSSTYRAILPLTDSHAGILGVYGALAQAAGKPSLAAWVAPALDPLEPTQQPPASPETDLVVAAMKGESQPGVINLANSTTSAITAAVSVSGLPGGDNPSWVAVNSVEWVDTFWGLGPEMFRPAACALTPLVAQAGGYPITIPAGMCRQVWLDFKPATNMTAGSYSGNVDITPSTGSSIQVPVTLKVFALTFPETPAMNVGGFEFSSETSSYGMTPSNKVQLISMLYSKFVRRAWGLGTTLPYGTYDSSGSMLTQPSTAHFDQWITNWPAGMQYVVFRNVGNTIGDSGTLLSRATPAFTNAVKNWVAFWANHLASNGIAPSRLLLHLYDEPDTQVKDQIVIDWATPIQEAATGIQVWENPQWGAPTNALPGLWPVCDILCPNRWKYIVGGQSFEDFYRNQHDLGRKLEFYAAGATRHIDPYSCYRLSAWDCFYMDGDASCFYSFVDNIYNSWNEYAMYRCAWAPHYMEYSSVNTAKGMEAIRLGVQDYEYLSMLSDYVAQMETDYPSHPSLSAAQALLSNACVEVLGATNADVWNWYDSGQKDRALADTVRIDIGNMLDTISLPAVTVSNITDGAIIVGANVTFNAFAWDYIGITRVEFYRDGQLLYTDYDPPYGFNWTNVIGGGYALTALAYDSDGNCTTSTVVNVEVWNDTDIGNVGQPGGAAYSNYTFTVSGAGAGF